MTPAELLTEIQNGPLKDQLAPLVAAGNDAGVAALLNARNLRGPVPIAALAAYCAKGITGGVQALNEIPLGATIPGGPVMTMQIKGALHSVLNLVQIDFRLETCDVDDPAFGGIVDGILVPFGIMTASDKTAMLALAANRLSRAEEIFGQQVSATDVARAFWRNG